MSKQTLDKDKAITFLRNEAGLAPGSKVKCALLHVSRSGMSRTVKVLSLVDGEIFNVSPWVARATGLPFDRDRGGVKVGGCGMDAASSLVYELSYTLFPGGFGCTGKGCPSNDHGNGDRDYAPDSGNPLFGNAHWHKDGGYALRAEWV